MNEGCQKLKKTQGPKSIREIEKVDTTERDIYIYICIYPKQKNSRNKWMKLPSSGFKVAIYIYTLYANGFPTVRSNKSREEKIHISFIFFLADSSAANSQNGGPGVCHFLVLVWASGVAGFSKMVSTPYSLANTLVLRWTPKSPA